jgi:hypothetical protein
MNTRFLGAAAICTFLAGEGAELVWSGTEDQPSCPPLQQCADRVALQPPLSPDMPEGGPTGERPVNPPIVAGVTGPGPAGSLADEAGSTPPGSGPRGPAGSASYSQAKVGLTGPPGPGRG